VALDIHTAVQTALLIMVVAIGISIWRGIVSIRSARRLPFFRMRRMRMVHGWRLLITAIVLVLLLTLMNSQLEPFIYRFYPPTATITLTPTLRFTPTISLTPTITLSSTITLTPSISDTPTITPTPFVPLAVEARFESTITPNPDALFSNLIFTQGIDEEYRPLNPNTVFQNPVGHLYALFSYDRMVDGSQWTALWYRNGELVYFETHSWNGGTGGFGYTDWDPISTEWQPGVYEVQIFIGTVWKISGRFTVEGIPPTPLPSATPTNTATPTRTPTPTRTRLPTYTLTPSLTPRPTRTPTRIPSLTPTKTPYISPTVTLTPTPYPTLTRTPVTPSITPWPTLTRTVTNTPRPAGTITPTATSR